MKWMSEVLRAATRSAESGSAVTGQASPGRRMIATAAFAIGEPLAGKQERRIPGAVTEEIRLVVMLRLWKGVCQLASLLRADCHEPCAYEIARQCLPYSRCIVNRTR